MKKNLFLSALAAVTDLMTSCSNDDFESSVTEADNTISFSTVNGNVSSRAAKTITDLEHFTVSANTPDNSIFFADQLFSYNQSKGVFTSATAYYWPLVGSLSFYAINEPGTKALNAANVPSYT